MVKICRCKALIFTSVKKKEKLRSVLALSFYILKRCMLLKKIIILGFLQVSPISRIHSFLCQFRSSRSERGFVQIFPLCLRFRGFTNTVNTVPGVYGRHPNVTNELESLIGSIQFNKRWMTPKMVVETSIATCEHSSFERESPKHAFTCVCVEFFGLKQAHEHMILRVIWAELDAPL